MADKTIKVNKHAPKEYTLTMCQCPLCGGKHIRKGGKK